MKKATTTNTKQKTSLFRPLKVALVHDYLREYGGAERVLEALHKLYPDAPVFTAFVDAQAMGIQWQRFADWDIRQSWMIRIPFYKSLYSPLRIIASRCFESFDLSEYDVVISSSNAFFAKAVRVPNGVHICYCHTPPRSLYGYNAVSDWKYNPVTRFAGTLLNHFTRMIDFYVSRRVQVFVANSYETKRRINTFYRMDAKVVYPPVQVDHGGMPVTEKAGSGYFLYVNRLALAKHPEIAVQACKHLGYPLKVVGVGPMQRRLVELAGQADIEFVGAVSDEKLHQLYARAQALLYPVEDEDFGIVPVEAMSHGVPVIAHASGGPLETVVDIRLAQERHQPATGILFSELSVAGLVQAIKLFQAHVFDGQAIAQYSGRFSEERFKREMQAVVIEALTSKS